MVQHLTLSLFLGGFLKDQYWVQFYFYYVLMTFINAQASLISTYLLMPICFIDTDCNLQTTLENRCLQNMVLNIFICLHLNGSPAYMKQMFPLRSVSYSLRGSNILPLPEPSTTSYGLNSFCYLALNSGTRYLRIIEHRVHTKTSSGLSATIIFMRNLLVY